MKTFKWKDMWSQKAQQYGPLAVEQVISEISVAPEGITVFQDNTVLDTTVLKLKCI